IINRFFRKDESGFFVDVGCFHPLKFNNTWMLYKKGWRGINIDIDPEKIEIFNIRRPEDLNIAIGIANFDGLAPCYSASKYSLTTTLSPDFAKDHGSSYTRDVKVAKLNDIIEASRWKGVQIDLLSVDVEGMDLDVLKSLDFKTYNPKLVVAEVPGATLGEIECSEVYKFLLSLGYKMIAWCGLSLLMTNREPRY
ncbi:FkbM family methyltransferase, partial [Mesorhizobium japonicum]|uniref:FkbM family methyltransferase n=1 Tax=Mesorhizobium japonicum TaxID=2066070 RepID=UPI003B5B8A64